MARRRGGAPAQAVVAGDVWRQRQHTAALAAALQQLPTGDALPLVLLRGLQRALRCVEHTLQGALWGDYDAVGAVAGDGDGGSSATNAAAAAAAAALAGVPANGVTEEHGRAQQALFEGSWGAGCEPSQERAAVERAVKILYDTLTAAAAGSGGKGWDRVSYTTALLHSYLALSSDLFDVSVERCTAESSKAANAPIGGGWRDFWRDELAVPARWRLPARLFGQIVTAMRLEAHLLDLMAWVPDPRVASDALAAVLEPCPALAAGLAAALLTAGNLIGPSRAVDAHLPSSAPAAAMPNRLAHSPWLLLRLSAAVRQATTMASAAADTEATVAECRRWLPCLLLFARALTDGLHRSRSTAAAAPAAAAASALDVERGGDDDTWADECCEALQEGLCLWQAHILALAAAAPVAEAAAEAAAEATATAAVVTVTEPPAAVATAAAAALLRLVGGQLREQLEGQQGAGGTGDGTGGAEGQQRLLSYNAGVRLRTRIALLGMQAAAAAPRGSGGGRTSPAASAAGAAAATAATADAEPQPHSAKVRGGEVELKAADVWLDLGLRRESMTGGKDVEGERAGGARGTAGGAPTGPPPPLPPLSPSPAASASSGLEAHVWEPPRRPTRPEWLRAATAAAGSAFCQRSGVAAADVTLPLLGCPQSPLPQPQPQPQPQAEFQPSVASAAAAATERVAAVTVALLTPGVGSWLRVQRDPRVDAAAGPEPYNPFRVALALLELLQGRQFCSLGFLERYTAAAAAAAADDYDDNDGIATNAVSETVGDAARSGDVRQLELRVLRMAVECMACVGAPAQQAALQEAFLNSRDLRSLRACLAADAELQAAAGRALVTLSNRAVAVEGSLERLALSAQQEAQRLAAAATDMLPYAVLVPEACVRRLVLDGLAHPGQQPWVLQLLRCFAVAAAAPAAGAAASAAAEPTPRPPLPVLLWCLRDVVVADEEDEGAARWVRSAADRRALLGLLRELQQAGLMALRHILKALVEPGLSSAPAGGRCLGSTSLTLHCALSMAQFALAPPGSGTAVEAAAAAGGGGSSYLWPAAELAAARPARLLLAVAGALRELYDAYESSGGRRRLEAAVIDTGVTVLERGVQLYGDYLRAGDADVDASHVQLTELAAGCTQLPRRLVAVMLPLLELKAASGKRARGRGTGDCDDRSAEGDDGDGGAGAEIRALATTFAPATTWRSRTLRTADAGFARDVMYDILTFAASSAANAAVVRQALLDAAADAAEDQDDPVELDVRGGCSTTGTSVWSTWGAEALHGDGAAASPPPLLPLQGARADAGVVACHVAATAARGLPQLPAVRLLEGGVAALSAVLPTATPEQARRLLLAVLPALVQAAGGTVALHGVMAEGRRASEVVATHGAPVDGRAPAPPSQLLSLEVVEAWLLAAPSRHRRCASAAAVAMSMVLTCRAAVVALRGAAAADVGAATESSPPVRPPALLPATADRCAAHLALLASRLSAAGVAAAAMAAATAEAVAPNQMGPTAAAVAASVGAPPAAAEPVAAGGASLEVAAVAVVLLSELCGVAAVAAELSTPGVDRVLDIWQAIILSVQQVLVAALATWGAPPPAFAAATDPALEADAVAKAATTTATLLLRSAQSALSTLPGATADVLSGSLELLCEECEPPVEQRTAAAPGAGAGYGWLSAAWLSAKRGQ